jgi:hypothetical protein
MSRFRRSDITLIVIGVLGVAFGVYVNPFLTTWWDQHQAIHGIVTLLVLSAVSLEVVRSLRTAGERVETSSPPTSIPAVLGFWLIMTAWAMLYRYPWSGHQLFADDYRYLSEAGRDWNGALQNLFKPFNEHLVVTTRIVTALFVHNGDFVSSRLATEDWCGRVAGLLFLMTGALLFEFLRRIWGERSALMGFALFAVSVCHSEVILWYSAAQWLIPVSLLLGSLLIVEQPGGKRLFAATFVSAFAPWNYSIGAIVGPFTTLWLLGWHRRWQWRSLLPALAGIASTIVVLMIVRRSMAEEQYWSSGGRGMFEAFSPWMGLIYSARLFADRLILVNLGYRGLPVSLLTATAIIGVMGIAIVAALRRRPSLAVLWPAAVLIVVGYGIAVPFRTWEPYESLASWNRYQLIPHLGLSMLVAGVVGDVVQRSDSVFGWRKLVWFTVGLSLWGLWQGRTLFYS